MTIYDEQAESCLIAPASTAAPTKLEELTDLALMEGVCQGIESSLEALFNRYRQVVYAIGRRVLNNESDAEEVLMDVFMELWRRSNRFDVRRGTVSTYLLVLARSRAIDHLRSRAARNRRFTQDGGQEMGRFADRGDTPAEAYWLTQRRQQVRQAMELLSPVQREAVQCAYFDGLTHAEIAERLAVPLGTIKTRIRLGLLRFRDALTRGGVLETAAENR